MAEAISGNVKCASEHMGLALVNLDAVREALYSANALIEPFTARFEKQRSGSHHSENFGQC